MSLYGAEEKVDSDRGWKSPLSFKQYLRLLLSRDFWSDRMVLYAVSSMWSIKITVLNTKTCRSTAFIMTGSLMMSMRCWPPTWLTTSMLQVSSQLSGRISYFAFQLWSGDWTGVPFTQLMYWSGDHFTTNFTVECMVLFFISVLFDEDPLKSVLDCSDLVVSTWKRDHPSDTEDDVLVRLSSKNEVEGLATEPRVARKGPIVPAAVPAEASESVLVVSHPSADEVLVKKRAFKVGQAAGFSSSSWERPSWGWSGQGGYWSSLSVACCS